MTMKLETVMTRSIAQLSYLIGDDATGTAAVIDPRPDYEVYLELARRHGLTITHVFETHIHADFMSGARELVARCGGSAKLCVSGEGDAQYGYEHQTLSDGEAFDFGSVRLTARHTPGHTPEHVVFLAATDDHPDDPWGVFTGDSLFVGSAGRPDLVHDERGKKLPDQLFDTLTGFYRGLDGGVIVLPGHGAGSGCGAGIGDRPLSTMAYERRHNPFLQHDDREDFKRFVKEGAPTEPAHYARLKKLNGQGPEILRGLPPCPALTVEALAQALDKGDVQLLDVRDMLAFGGGHIPGAINIANQPEISNWAGWLLDAGRPLLLVLEHDAQLDQVRRRLLRVGLTRFVGYLAGGISTWIEAGRHIQALPQWSVHELRRQLPDAQLLDVREKDEYEAGHVPGARHIALHDLSERLNEIDRDHPVATFCGSGYRASIAASILQRHDFSQVHNVIGSWKAWRASE